MRRITKHVLISAIALSITAGVVFAASVHVKNPPPTATYDRSALTLTVSGALSGLGNETLTITVSADVTPTAICSNKGQNAAPGQQPAQVNVTGVTQIPASSIINGNVSFTVITVKPSDPPSGTAAGCANDNWTGHITCLAFTSYTITVVQGGKTSQFTFPFVSSCP